MLPAETIHAIGRDAVMIDDETGLILPDDAPADVGGPPSGRDVTGDDVLTEQGTSLGKVRDVVVLVGSKGEVSMTSAPASARSTTSSTCHSTT